MSLYFYSEQFLNTFFKQGERGEGFAKAELKAKRLGFNKTCGAAFHSVLILARDSTNE